MNATIRPEQIDETPEVDNDLAAVSEVEAGIREFVRNDIAYLRRPAVAAETAPLDANAEATVNNVNSLIQRVAGTSLAEIEKLISELESLRDLLHAEGPARPARDLGLCPAQPGCDEVDAHDRRQRHAVEARRRRPAQQLTRSLQKSDTPPCSVQERGGFVWQG